MTFMQTGFIYLIACICGQISLMQADSLYCLSCKSVISPRHCHTVEKCADGEFCYTEKILNINGQELYNIGCQEETFCNSTTNPIGVSQPFGNPFEVLNRNFQPHFAECTECCATDVCNQHGCGSEGYPIHRGPLCFNCPQSNNPSLCETVDVCNVDEVCHIHLEREFGDAFYSQSCQKKRSCLRQETSSIFGKRSEQSCTNCCERDLCNIRVPISGDNMSRWTTICAVSVGTYCRQGQYVQNDNMYRHRGTYFEDYLRNYDFATFDRDSSYSCARGKGAGWWYNDQYSGCSYTHVNLNLNFYDTSNIPWSGKVSRGKLLSTKMMITRNMTFFG